MCGICGYYNCNLQDKFDKMLNQMFHRGPDEKGTHIADGVGLGIRRLSIIDVEGGQQPIANENETIWVVQNGEIYNYRELRDELIRNGHIFTTSSDTEVIVHLYEQEGENIVNRLRGMYAIALWDSSRKIFYLIRDRLGIKPLYYCNYDKGLVFASELGSLSKAFSSMSIRPQAIFDYLNFLYIPAPDTIFENVSQVLPGQYLKIEGEKRTFTKYYDINEKVLTGNTSNKILSLNELEEQFIEVLQDTVSSHLISDVPLGLFLSGGLDSGAMLAMMRKISNGEIKTFSIGYADDADKDFNETDASGLLAKTFGANHTQEMIRPNVVEILPKIVESMGEPYADSSAIPTYLVSEIARKSVTVALSGIGGDELFGGYPRYLGMQSSSYFNSLPRSFRWFMAKVIAPQLYEKGTHSDKVGRIKRFLKTGLLPLESKYLAWVTFLQSEWGNNAFNDNYLRNIDSLQSINAYKDIFNNWPSNKPADKAMGLDLQTYLPDDLLRMGDRLSMAHSLELRVPFCDHKLLEFALKIPVNIRMKGLKLKSFMRHCLKSYLPKQIIKGQKKGFMIPIARWLRQDLEPMVKDLLNEKSIKDRGYLKPSYVNWLINEHMSGRRNFSDQLFSLLVLELWLKNHA